ncbi:MAG: NIPSNAP family protein [Magnetospiraceae bacterium]
MLYELRAYDLTPGMGPAYLDLFRKQGLQYVTCHLPMGGYWLTDSGALNRLYHLWIYADLEERLACRASLATDKDWNETFVPKGFPLIQAQRNRLMVLEAGSDAFASIKESRQESHAAQTEDTPMFAAGYLCLTESDVTLPHEGALLGQWRVISGEDPGKIITLSRLVGATPPPPGAGVQRSELLRSASFSPLK